VPMSLWATGVITVLIVAYGFASASANPLTPFRYESQAQRHCPADVIVWLNTSTAMVRAPHPL
jgi:hypothetical protein